MTANENSLGDVVRQGRVWIPALAILTAVLGWFAYDRMAAPGWARDFGLDMAARSKIVSSSADETAFSTLKGRVDPDSPYICLSKSASFDWDRVFFVASGGEMLNTLADLDWGDFDLRSLKQRMDQDSRYQLIVFEDGGKIVEHSYYFTLWADLSRLANPKGFDKQNAVFVAESDGRVYTLTPAESYPNTACK